ncbi:spore coat protein [Paenibacillus dendritiformis]|uniref:spore coat protein n=1 Tax=Paenibacillus dendritiformis TaxID=130049 RepID=UPI0018CE4540|nr:spore coat protein [Paenibacillus dendritiformis]MBG9794401.1 spore coat protein [Paenibacillus dendritiformis]
MRMTLRIIRLIAIIVTVSVLSGFITIATTAVVVDRYIQSALNTFQIPIERPSLTLTTMWGELFGSGGKAAQPDSSKQTPQSPQAPAAGKKAADPPKEDPGDGALPVMGGISSAEAAERERVVISPDALSRNKEEIPASDKEQLFATLMKKLPQEEMQRLSTLMEDGLTAAELTEAEQILAKYLNDEEYGQMLEWLKGKPDKAEEPDASSEANDEASAPEGTGTP